MSDKEEQDKPLEKTAYRRINIERPDAFSGEFMTRRNRNCIKCFGCATAILLIIATVILVLMFTVFHIKDPVLNMDSMSIEGLNNSTNLGPGLNLTVEADVSIENPNVSSFKFINMTMNLYYNDTIIGETTNRSGEARARRTARMRVWIEVMVDKMLQVGRWKSDLDRGLLSISLSVRIYGKVRITNAIKRSVVLNMNCTMNVNIRSQGGIQDRNCRRTSSL